MGAATPRPATLADLEALVALEMVCFSGDRLTRRQFRHLLRRGHGVLLVVGTDARAEGPASGNAAGADVLQGQATADLAGYVLVLLNRATRVARLYSIAVADAARGRGLGRRLAQAAEQVAMAAGRGRLRLEIRETNLASQRLFTGLGYTCIGRRADYYEDGMTALRYEKLLMVEEVARGEGRVTRVRKP